MTCKVSGWVLTGFVVSSVVGVASSRAGGGGGEFPVCDPGGDYTINCSGPTQVDLDGSGSFDPNGNDLVFTWSTDCPGASFDDDTSPTPILTLDGSGCIDTCTVDLIVDTVVAGSGCKASVTVVGSPTLTCPADDVVVCGGSINPIDTGAASATDGCGHELTEDYVDVSVPTTCLADPVLQTIERTWYADEACDELACTQTIPQLKIPLKLDVMPGTCPNNYSIGGGILLVALPGSNDLDVLTINASTLRISRADCVGGSQKPSSTFVADLATPFLDAPCNCHDLDGDGHNDLVMRFKKNGLTTPLQLSTLQPGESLMLAVSGTLTTGCKFVAYDCITIPGNPLQ